MDYKRASREELERLANSKDGEAVCELGERYLYGTDGYEVNVTKAYQLFHKGEKMGLPRAYAGLGEMYQKGLFFARNENLAREYYKKAGIPYPVMDPPPVPNPPPVPDPPPVPNPLPDPAVHAVTYTDLKSKLETAEAARKGEAYGRAKSLCYEAIHTVEQICSGMIRYSGNEDVTDFLIEANWILAYTAFNEQDYSKMEDHLAFDGVYGRYPWSLYLAAVVHRIINSPPAVMEQDLQMLNRVKENQNLSRMERGDIWAMIGDLAADGYGARSGIKPNQARVYYEEAMNCGNQYGRERYYEMNEK